jgi:hypothetical protein
LTALKALGLALLVASILLAVPVASTAQEDVYVFIEYGRIIRTGPNPGGFTIEVRISLLRADGSSVEATDGDVEIALPAKPELWKHAVVDGIAAVFAPGGRTVLRVIFPDFTSLKP